MVKVSLLPYLNNLAYASPQHCSDYQQDQIAHGLSSLDEVLFQQLPQNPYLYKTSDKEDIKKIWGMGFSLYGLLENKQVRFEVGESDLIIISLHHTMCNDLGGFYDFVKGIIDYFKKSVVVVDGHDMPNYNKEIPLLCPYFKRELIDEDPKVYPLFFGIPEEKFCHGWRWKQRDFSDMIPGMFSWNHPHTDNYHKYKTEEEYYIQYQESYFAYNCCKAGWASGRMNEIIVNRCLPFFTDIEKCPPRCLYRYPKDLCQDIKRMKGVYPGTIHPFNPEVNTFIGDTRQIKGGNERGYINFDEFDTKLYDKYVWEIFEYSLKNLTTKALAKYILEKSL